MKVIFPDTGTVGPTRLPSPQPDDGPIRRNRPSAVDARRPRRTDVFPTVVPSSGQGAPVVGSDTNEADRRSIAVAAVKSAEASPEESADRSTDETRT
jgi:hypothetical protein